ncbi:uncharacterized protein LOC62_06G008038 [Vanrija pseudolonga]|uniref:Uncharacterized protein n=1 Tax=Vanrija pseudolonga TaxID=143232 RepID=A0AAF1BKD6_9TREE|nr:hypothetical protein LOC62_06G008038 [Vanrija pseudolonga]
MPPAQPCRQTADPRHAARRPPSHGFCEPFGAPAHVLRQAPTTQWYQPPAHHLPLPPPQHPAYHRLTVQPVLPPSPPHSAGRRTTPIPPAFLAPPIPVCVVNNPTILLNRQRLALPVVLAANGGMAVAREYGTLELKPGPDQPPMMWVIALCAPEATKDILGGDIGFRVH